MRKRRASLLQLKLWDLPRPQELLREYPAHKWRLGLEFRHGVGGFNISSTGVDGEFDELVVGDWLHIERMDERVWWMQVGERTFDIEIPEDPQQPVIVQERED